MFVTQFSLTTSHKQRISGVPAGHDARLILDLAVRAGRQPIVYVATDEVKAALLIETIGFFSPDLEVIPFPAWDCLPYDRISPHPDIASQRIAALMRLKRPFDKPALIVTTVNALIQRVVPPEALDKQAFAVSVGDTLDLDKLTLNLVASGYHKTSTVREVGEFAVRGGIIDLYPAALSQPLRIDLFGQEVEAIRAFDPLSQITTGTVDHLSMIPTSEVILEDQTVTRFRGNYRELFGSTLDNDPLYEAVSTRRKFPGVEHWLPLFYDRLVGLLDYLPAVPVFFEAQATDAILSRFEQINDFYQARQSLFTATLKGKNKESVHNVAPYKPVPVEQMFLSPEDIDTVLKGRALGVLSPFQEPDDSALFGGGQIGRDFADARGRGDMAELYKRVKDYIQEHQGMGRRVALACYTRGSAERLSSIFKAHQIDVMEAPQSWREMTKLDPKLITIMILGIEHGFVSPDLVVITEQDILGDRLVRKPKKKKLAAQFQLELDSLNVGDYVVHSEHGIGRYEGFEAINALGAVHDCIKLIYDGGDKLYLPVENLEALTRYANADSAVVLDKLGGAGWQSRKARVKKRLLEIADSLIKIAAERHLRKADIIAPEQGGYHEFSARFPYNETEDQANAIDSVMDDFSSGRPMDRLVCGDVGFGKTEVALRAAFAAASSGLQVAVVAPTTLLVRQHFQNFVTRFKGFPYRIVQLSRMVNAKESKENKRLLADGEAQIVVGTHAVLSKDVKFQNLGLVIIDEEQHFGVKQKEQLKEMRADVHVLTLTATPIPRTLQLALTGVRELSLITTPPVDRLAVSTYVLPFDPLVIREALMREHYRGGQSFYVCPRIEDLLKVQETLRELVPELKMVSAHGRMSPTELDDIMTAFDARKYDLLLATNIIESGLDIPNANTIILHRADMFGLAQLYQLRGRVGRAKQRGYAYFTYNPVMPLSSTAQQRLEVISTLDQLGAGFQLASHDMDIRGTGNLLGEEQSGHIREVGIELYQQMLEDAIAAVKAGGGVEAVTSGQTVTDRWSPQINIGLSVMIPETYVADANVRMGLYRRLAEGSEEQDTDSIAAEMLDRFGPLPEEVENLLQTVNIKLLCKKAGIAKLDVGPKGAVIGFYQDSFAHPERLIPWIAAQTGTAKVRPDQKLVVMRVWDDMERRIQGIKQLLGEIISLAQ
ncbi:MAG: transcription-repair coupling factor [Proteobacteria bacterium]|nr:transcription-repair coupling factor [Pseudomonadota bacterium]